MHAPLQSRRSCRRRVRACRSCRHQHLQSLQYLVEAVTGRHAPGTLKRSCSGMHCQRQRQRCHLRPQPRQQQLQQSRHAAGRAPEPSQVQAAGHEHPQPRSTPASDRFPATPAAAAGRAAGCVQEPRRRCQRPRHRPIRPQNRLRLHRRMSQLANALPLRHPLHCCRASGAALLPATPLVAVTAGQRCRYRCRCRLLRDRLTLHLHHRRSPIRHRHLQHLMQPRQHHQRLAWNTVP